MVKKVITSKAANGLPRVVKWFSFGQAGTAAGARILLFGIRGLLWSDDPAGRRGSRRLRHDGGGCSRWWRGTRAAVVALRGAGLVRNVDKGGLARGHNVGLPGQRLVVLALPFAAVAAATAGHELVEVLVAEAGEGGVLAALDGRVRGRPRGHGSIFQSESVLHI